MFKGLLFGTALTVAAIVKIGSAHAALVNLGEGSFTPAAPVIDFSSPGVGGSTSNPVYQFSGLPGIGDETVSFGSYFVGQSPIEAPPPAEGGVITLDPHNPTGPLALASDPANTVFITDDGSSTTNPVLSGTPTFNGPISVLFSTPVAAVGLTGGFFNAAASTTIEAYDSNGNVLGYITNSTTGFEFYGLFDSASADIAGISFFITGDEPAGFEIDNLTFGLADDVVPPTDVPEPASLALFGLGLATIGLLRRARRS